MPSEAAAPSAFPTWLDMGLFAGLLCMVGIVVFFLWAGGGKARANKRAVRLRARNSTRSFKEESATSLRRKTGDDSLPWLQMLVNKLPTLTQLHGRLERAGMRLTAERYILLNAGLFLLTVFSLMVLLHKSIWLGIFMGIVLGVGLPHFIVGFKVGKRLKRFIQLFPDGIDLIVRGLRSGLPVSESISLVSHEVPDPVAGVFQSVADRMKLGVPMESALQEIARKLQCTEFNFFVTSIILQRETGGNLSEILNNLSDVLRKRFMMRMKIKAMTSEAKASTIIVGSLPFIVMLAVYFMSPGYMDPLFDDRRGNLAAIGAMLSLATGVTIMIKMAKFEI